MSRVIDVANDTRLYDTNVWRNKNVIAPHIAQIGTGGTGTLLVQMIANILSALHGVTLGRYLIADSDIVEKKNLRNQLFIEKDIGKKKADVLATRYRNAFQIDLQSYSLDYIEDIQTLHSLYNSDYMGHNRYPNTVYFPILIGSVDNTFTRRLMHEYFEQQDNLLYIDVGNSSASVPNDYPKRPMRDWTNEERKAFDESGFSGQCCVGLKIKGKVELEPAGVIFPDLLEMDEEDEEDNMPPSEASCANLAASAPQKLMTNRYAAMTVATYLNEFLSMGTISNHYTLFNAKKGFMRSIPIQEKVQSA